MKKGIWMKLKPHLPYFLSILGGVFLMCLVWTMKGTVGFVLGVVAMAMVIGGLFSWSNYLGKVHEEKDPYFYDDPVYEMPWEKVFHYGSGVFMILCLIVGFVTQVWSENLISENTIFIILVLIGFLVASLILVLLKKVIPSIFISNETRWDEILCVWIGLVCLTIVGGVGVIFYPEPVSSREMKVRIIEHGSNRREPQAYVWVDYEGEKLRLRPKKTEFQNLKGKDSTNVIISKSFIGVEYICEMLPD